MRYKDKVTIVTGGTQGIGKGIVQVFVENGSKVVIAGIEDEDGKRVAGELGAAGPGQVHYVHCDVRNEEQVKNLMEETVKTFGQLDCLINNAGVHPPDHTIDEISLSEFKSLLDINVIGYFLTSKYALPHLRKTKGNIINNCSIVAHIGQPGAMDYITSKGAVNGMTKALAIDEAKHGVRVNAFSVSSVWTPLWESWAKTCDDPDAIIKQVTNRILLNRFGTNEEVGQLCLFLAAEGTFCTGVDIPISGGLGLGDR